MSTRSSDFGERLRHVVSRIGLRDAKTQISAASIVLVIALIALPLTGSGNRSEEVSRVDAAQQATDLGAPLAPPGSESSRANPRTVTSGEGGSRAAAAAPAAQASVPPGVPAAPPGKNAQGVSDDEILIGDVYDVHQGSFNAAFGAAGIGQIDLKRAVETVVAYINSHGGIGGRKIKIVWHKFDSLDPNQNSDKLQQEICTTWTQDHHVFAGMSGGSETLNACLTKAGVPSVVAGNVGDSDSRTFKENPYFIALGGPAFDRLAKFYVDELFKAGYYSKGRTDQYGAALGKMPFKLGVVSYDDPAFDRAIEVYRKALAARGIKLSNVAQIHAAESNAAAADEIAATRQAVLKFKADNVTHVQFLSTPNGFEQLNFWTNADTQRYYPRYGLSSNDPAQALKATIDSKSGTGAFTRTFQQTLGVGWTPLFDQARADYTGSKELPALRKCKEILSHEKYDDSSRNKEAQAAITCDSYFYLKTAIENGGPIVNQRTFLDGVAKATNVPSAWTFDMGTSATRHDGMGAIREFQFGADDNFHYTSGLKPV